MSVYTPLTATDVDDFFASYALGTVVAFSPTPSGTTNSNFFVTTSSSDYVLTVFETLQHIELPFFIALVQHYHAAQLPVAPPLANTQGEVLHTLYGKPAMLSAKLPGTPPLVPSLGQCQAIGDALAKLHLSGASFTKQRAPDRGPNWWQSTALQLQSSLTANQQRLLEDEQNLQQQQVTREATLPQAIIHADLFRDNTLFLEDQLSGIIDFYFSCNNAAIYDLAITANDWCFQNDALDTSRLQALVKSYHARRPLTQDECAAWPWMLRRTALRFWLSRLAAMHLEPPSANQAIQRKDPKETENMLIYYRKNNPKLPPL